MPTQPLLIVLGGLPGSGKSTIAKMLARQLALVYVRVDEIEQALLRHLPDVDCGAAGYGIAYAVASSNLALGSGVVADSVNPVAASRAGWAAAGRHAAILKVEIICSDPAAHRRRVEQRSADIDGHALPTWADVLALSYEPWPDADLVIDTASNSAADAAGLIVGAVAQRI
jgi:predicted kinase